MINGFLTALAFAWRPENDGQYYHVDKNDSGGGTSWGVTESTWETAIIHGYVEDGDLENAKKEQLQEILRAMFWNAIAGDALPFGVDQVVFDMAMVAGPGRAARILQTIVGTVVDGAIGPLTLAAVAKMDPRIVVDKLTSSDERYFAGLHGFTWFGRGWTRRAEDCRAAALQLIGKAGT